MENNLNPRFFKKLIINGQLKRVTVTANPSGFNVFIRTKEAEQPLTTFRGNVRNFKNLETVVSYLHEFNVMRFEMDIRLY